MDYWRLSQLSSSSVLNTDERKVRFTLQALTHNGLSGVEGPLSLSLSLSPRLLIVPRSLLDLGQILERHRIPAERGGGVNIYLYLLNWQLKSLNWLLYHQYQIFSSVLCPCEISHPSLLCLVLPLWRMLTPPRYCRLPAFLLKKRPHLKLEMPDFLQYLLLSAVSTCPHSLQLCHSTNSKYYLCFLHVCI